MAGARGPAVHPVVRLLAWVWTRWLDDALRSRVMWWLNAKFAVGVTGIVRNDAGEVLFLGHGSREGPLGARSWALPGARVGRREPLEGALLRELREEAGLQVEVERVLAAHTLGPGAPRLDVTYLCRVRGGAPRAGSVAWLWCPPDRLLEGADPASLRLLRLLPKGLGRPAPGPA